MHSKLKFLLFVVLLFVLTFSFKEKVRATPNCSDINSLNPGDYDFCITQINNTINELAPAQQNNKNQLAGLNTQLTSLQNEITAISGKLDSLTTKIAKREDDLAYTKGIFNEKVGDQYKFLRTYDPLMPFLDSSSAANTIEELTLREKVANEDRTSIENYAEEIASLNSDKSTLEKNKANLAIAQANINKQAVWLAGEVAKVDSYLSQLSSEQQQLQALKAGGFSTSVGSTPDTFDPCSGPPGSSTFCNPGFSPAFAAFSFGAPHRTGMSQYGAYGRSMSGQSYQTILSAYFQGSQLVTGYNEPGSITVSGYGSVPFEDNYLMGIYEIPESWGNSGGFAALEAQAIAARTYALYATNNGANSICADESCQVYSPNLKTGKWRDAVNATRGMVLLRGGSIAPAYYASTAGGWTISQWGWSGIKDTSGDWPATAYEKLAGSPWFYKGWYKSRGGATCGENNPWLTGTQIADILNAWNVLTNGGGDSSRISPTDTSCWSGNPYSVSDLQGIGGFNSVSDVSVIYDTNGSTQSLTFQTNKGTVTVSGGDFKKAFNLRAPGYIGIKSSLFNIEKL